MSMWIKCPNCNGTGAINGKYEGCTKKCPTCNGRGIINELTGLPPFEYSEDEHNEHLIDTREPYCHVDFPNEISEINIRKIF